MSPRLVLIDPDERRDVLARRLRSQGFEVDVYGDPAAGANAALAAPPDAVVADLWMPGISGVPLTRLLTSEPATMEVPIILRATSDEPRNRFWARHAGAAAYVAKGRMGELVRALKRLIGRKQESFFLQLGATADVRDRLSEHLDRALFESVLASEVRALGSVGSFERLMDLLSQLLVQITTYRWLAVRLNRDRLGVHCRPEHRDAHLAEVLEVLPGAAARTVALLEDDDAEEGPKERLALVAPIVFGGQTLGTLALSPTPRSDADQALVDLVARELGGPVRIVDLVEETQRLATTDTLTGLLRRAPFCDRLAEWFLEDRELAVLLVDLDRFKSINDEFGHRGGDQALKTAADALLRATTGLRDVTVARWGGEEFVVAAPDLDLAGGLELGRSIARSLRETRLMVNGRRVPITGSIGVSVREAADNPEGLVDRSDQGMYAAKAAGRDCVCAAPARVEDAPSPPPLPGVEAGA